MKPNFPALWLLRHGETEWTLAGKHTGRTDISLTPCGENQALALGQHLQGQSVPRVLTSPLVRAHKTCMLAGFGDQAEIEPDLMEWDYGQYEGLTTAQIRTLVPGWTIWSHAAPGGETPEDVAQRADRVIARVREFDEDVALFAHGHLLRVLAARWLGLPASMGGSLVLDTASASLLSTERERPVIRHWNEICHLEGAC